MTKHLVIVESPAKGKTIEKYLGKDYKVLASYGHVRELIPKDDSVDTDHHYEMKYQVIDRNKKHIANINKALKEADALLLATDPDREGEAISWHLYELLKEMGALKNKSVHRVVFNEITKKAIVDAVENPRNIAFDLVDAQKARSALDYLVGFNLSPLLWRKIKGGLSAGRVQSPALRLIVEREKEITAFVKQEYWTLQANIEKDEQAFQAKLHSLGGKRLGQFDISHAEQAQSIQQDLLQKSQGHLTVSKVEKKQRKRYAAPPFTTSTLQQEAVRKLRFTSQRAMKTAQQLYEGVQLKDGQVGLITYMRTDSVHLSNEALNDIRAHIAEQYGQDYLPEKPNFYKTKAKNAQEAHEAIRPTLCDRTPAAVKAFLTDDQFRLYELIWKRTVASQMIYAVIDTVSTNLEVESGSFFRASGSTIRSPGFLSVYEESIDDAQKNKTPSMPNLSEGDRLPLKEIETHQHFTEPPPRYTEASLVKALEEFGIGRPSTYASIISTLQSRNYVELNSRRFFPTDIGEIVNEFLTQHFERYVDYEFTAQLENQLDEISRGEQTFEPVMDQFWKPFSALVDEKMETVQRGDVIQARELGMDPKTGKPVSVRLGRYGALAQIGAQDDEDKPQFASLRPGMKINTISLEEALELFKLPRSLGHTPEDEPLSVNIGRFGPYVRYGNKFASLGKEDDPYTIELERALELVAAKKSSDLAKIIKDFGDQIQIVKGRWGPFVTDGKLKIRLAKDVEVESLDKADCIKLIEDESKKKTSVTKKKKTDVKVKSSKDTSKKKATSKTQKKTRSSKSKGLN